MSVQSHQVEGAVSAALTLSTKHGVIGFTTQFTREENTLRKREENFSQNKIATTRLLLPFAEQIRSAPFRQQLLGRQTLTIPAGIGPKLARILLDTLIVLF